MANGTSKITKKFVLYLDASVLVSFLDAESDSICELLSLCRKKDVEINVSPFTIMESLNIKQEHKFFNKKVAEGMSLRHILSNRDKRDLTHKDLKDIYDIIRRKLKPYEMETFYDPEDRNWWKLALNIVRDSNINSADALHLALSIFLDCNILVTTDTFFIEQGNRYIKEKLSNEDLIICLPEQARDIIKVSKN